MANRKVLINRHSSKPVAPEAINMYLGEIAVSHPTDLSATTIYTRNGDVMVPFASCAMTMSMINNAISAADVTYEVKAAKNDAHIEVKASGDKAKVFEVSSKDVQSKTEFEAYSSKTTNALDTLTKSFSDLLDVTLTGGTGDTIITVSTASTDASANTFSVTHKTATAVTGFNKLATDAYGHVTAATPVTTSDIEGLGFKDSAWTEGQITSAVNDKINALDVETVSGVGQAITAISQTDGKISAVAGDIAAAHVTVADADGKLEATTVEAALAELADKAKAITITNTDKSINVTSGDAGTVIDVNIKSNDPILAKNGGNGVYSTLNLVKIETGLPTTVKERYELQGVNGVKIGQDIDIPKDSHIVSITFITDSSDAHYQNLEYKYLDVNGAEKTEYIDISSLVLEAEFASGITVTNHVAHGVVDSASEKFLTVGADGFKLSGVQAAIDAAVNALDVTDAAVAGQYVSSVSETDGKIAVTRADISKAPLNEYVKGSDATAVAAADNINQAISKLENQIDKAKAAATTKVVEGTDEGNNMTIVPSNGVDGSVTYTVSLTDVASKAALEAEIAARKAVEGQGDTYAANAGTNYISAASSLNDADVKLDAALKAEETARTNQDNTIEASVGLAADGSHVKTNGTYTSAATTVVGEIAALDEALKTVSDAVDRLDYTGLTNQNTKVVTDVKQENGLVSASATTVGDLVITAITASEAKVAANDSLATIAGKLQGQIDAMDSSAETSGNGYFLTSIKIVDGKITTVTQSNKADSASSADKVVNTLTMRDAKNSQAFDGSAAKSLTFGTNVTADGLTDRSSMSMTADGTVDVEIIDCGTY